MWPDAAKVWRFRRVASEKNDLHHQTSRWLRAGTLDPSSATPFPPPLATSACARRASQERLLRLLREVSPQQSASEAVGVQSAADADGNEAAVLRCDSGGLGGAEYGQQLLGGRNSGSDWIAKRIGSKRRNRSTRGRQDMSSGTRAVAPCLQTLTFPFVPELADAGKARKCHSEIHLGVEFRATTPHLATN